MCDCGNKVTIPSSRMRPDEKHRRHRTTCGSSEHRRKRLREFNGSAARRGKNQLGDVPETMHGASITWIDLPHKGSRRVGVICPRCSRERESSWATIKGGHVLCRPCSKKLLDDDPHTAGEIVGCFTIKQCLGWAGNGWSYLVRDNECGCEKQTTGNAYSPFKGIRRLCQHGVISVKNSGQGYVHWRWTMPGGKRVTVPEHKIVMESLIGREMLPDEEVHHKNTQRGDNSPENLELWVHGQPKGGRVADMVAWARELLQRYEPAEVYVSELEDLVRALARR